jgi:putative membrane protein
MINRRGALTNISGGVAAVSLLLATGSRSARAQATIGGADYKMQTLMVGTLSKEQSQIALTQATHPKVKEFAQFEVDEQSTIAQVLSDLANPPPAPLDQAHQAILSRLQSTTGKSFDAAYIADQIQGHQQLFAIQQAFLNSKPASMDHEHIAMLARTVIQMHLTMLADLQRMVGAA